MSGFVEFIVACSWETLTVLLTLLQFSIAFSLDLVLAFVRSGVDVLAGFGANMGFWSCMLCVWLLLSGRDSRVQNLFDVVMLHENRHLE
jgi:hypothetical protein